MENIAVSQESIEVLPEYASISIAFEVTHVFDVAEQPEGFALSERELDHPYLKNYDAIVGETPLHWGERFNLSDWGFFVARCGAQLAGGAAVAFNTAGIDMLEGRDDLAVLWDIRVAADFRGRGVGRALFQAAENWATAKGCHQLKIETQNTNAPACSFYGRQGCILVTVNRHAYDAFPCEVQLLWYKKLR